MSKGLMFACQHCGATLVSNSPDLPYHEGRRCIAATQSVDKAGAGDAGKVTSANMVVVGPCRCGAELKGGMIPHPDDGEMTYGLLHPVPFCHYFGITDAQDVARDAARRRNQS